MLPEAAILGLPDGEAPKQRREVGTRVRSHRHLEEALQHGDVQRLAEPPGTAEQRDRRPRFQDVGDEHRLVDEHRGSHDRLEIAVPDGQPLLTAKIRQARRALPVYAVLERGRLAHAAPPSRRNHLPAIIRHEFGSRASLRFGRCGRFAVVSVALRSFLRSFRSRLKRQLARTQPPDIPFANATVRARTWRPGCRRVPGSGRATRPDR